MHAGGQFRWVSYSAAPRLERTSRIPTSPRASFEDKTAITFWIPEGPWRVSTLEKITLSVLFACRGSLAFGRTCIWARHSQRHAHASSCGNRRHLAKDRPMVL